MFKSRSTERHPFSSLLLLLLLVFTCAIVFTIIAFVAGILIYGFQPIIRMSEGDSSNVEMLRLLQIVSSFGMFVVAAFIFAKIQSNDWLTYLNLKKFNQDMEILTARTFAPTYTRCIVQAFKYRLYQTAATYRQPTRFTYLAVITTRGP